MNHVWFLNLPMKYRYCSFYNRWLLLPSSAPQRRPILDPPRGIWWKHVGRSPANFFYTIHSETTKIAVARFLCFFRIKSPVKGWKLMNHVWFLNLPMKYRYCSFYNRWLLLPSSAPQRRPILDPPRGIWWKHVGRSPANFFYTIHSETTKIAVARFLCFFRIKSPVKGWKLMNHVWFLNLPMKYRYCSFYNRWLLLPSSAPQRRPILDPPRGIWWKHVGRSPANFFYTIHSETTKIAVARFLCFFRIKSPVKGWKLMNHVWFLNLPMKYRYCSFYNRWLLLPSSAPQRRPILDPPRGIWWKHVGRSPANFFYTIHSETTKIAVARFLCFFRIKSPVKGWKLMNHVWFLNLPMKYRYCSFYNRWLLLPSSAPQRRPILDPPRGIWWKHVGRSPANFFYTIHSETTKIAVARFLCFFRIKSPVKGWKLMNHVWFLNLPMKYRYCSFYNRWLLLPSSAPQRRPILDPPRGIWWKHVGRSPANFFYTIHSETTKIAVARFLCFFRIKSPVKGWKLMNHVWFLNLPMKYRYCSFYNRWLLLPSSAPQRRPILDPPRGIWWKHVGRSPANFFYTIHSETTKIEEKVEGYLHPGFPRGHPPEY